MGVVLKPGIASGRTHDQRLSIARQIADMCIAKHGDRIAAICVYGSTAVDLDLPYSDLDMTVLTRVDLDRETRCYTHDGLTINLDYQTIEDTIREEVDVPGEAGCWTSVLVLHDPERVVDDLRARYGRLSEDDYRRRFATLMADHLPTAIGKVRNGVIAKARSHFLWALHDFGDVTCKALRLLNRRYVTAQRAMVPACQRFEDLPQGFAELMDLVLGETEASDQVRYEAVETLWEGMQDLAAERGVEWEARDLKP
jgi:kanamycin nucleotidyltransferase